MARLDDPLDLLLSRVAAGDREAFDAVYVRVSSPVYGLVRRVLRDGAQSEEVAREVLLHVWATAAHFDGSEGSAISWVMTIAHRRAVERVRREEAAGRSLRRAAGDGAAVPAPTAAPGVAARVDQGAVKACLVSLGSVQRESLTLAYYGGLTHRQVAGEMSIPPAGAATGIRDGLLHLRSCLAADRCFVDANLI